MKTAKKSSGAAAGLLNELVSDAAQISAQVEALTAVLKAKHESIKVTMNDAGLERFAADDGSEALIIDAEVLTWDVEKLEKFLCTEMFQTMCPRKPNGTELRKLLDVYGSQPYRPGISGDAKALRGCSKAKKQKRLEVRAPVAAGATNVDVAADKAA